MLAHGGALVADVAELPGILGAGSMPEPQWTRVHRWTFASARSPHPASFALAGPLAVCGDGWGPRSRVEHAWPSGDALGAAMVRRLGASAGVG